MNRAEMIAMLKECSPQELRVLKYEMKGGHKCSNSTSLYHCCNEARCEACHVPHLKEVHDEPALWAYEKFVDKWQLTWAGYVPTKEKKKVIHRNIPRPAPKVISDPLAGVTDDNLDEVLALLAKKLGRQV